MVCHPIVLDINNLSNVGQQSGPMGPFSEHQINYSVNSFRFFGLHCIVEVTFVQSTQFFQRIFSVLHSDGMLAYYKTLVQRQCFFLFDDSHGLPSAKLGAREESGTAQHADDNENEPHCQWWKMETMDAEEYDANQNAVVDDVDDHAPKCVARAANCSRRD